MIAYVLIAFLAVLLLCIGPAAAPVIYRELRRRHRRKRMQLMALMGAPICVICEAETAEFFGTGDPDHKILYCLDCIPKRRVNPIETWDERSCNHGGHAPPSRRWSQDHENKAETA